VTFVSFVVRQPLERGRRDERGTRNAEGGTGKQENGFVLFVSFVVKQPLEFGARSAERKKYCRADLRTAITNGANASNRTNAF